MSTYKVAVKELVHDLLIAAREINNKMPEFTMDEIIESLKELVLSPKESTIAVIWVCLSC